MNIVILNTGCANLFSLKWAIERLGYTPTVSHDFDIAFHADKLFLPGVGTAKAAMKQLKERNLINLIQSYNKPVLGICLGMQLLGSTSDENNGVTTLNIIDKPVVLMSTQGLPLPHMGWNQITIKTEHYLFRKIPNRSYFYFVHSYFMEVNENTIATCKYGLAFTAALQYENFFGVQFHPERSGKNGAQLLKNFLEIE